MQLNIQLDARRKIRILTNIIIFLYREPEFKLMMQWMIHTIAGFNWSWFAYASIGCNGLCMRLWPFQLLSIRLLLSLNVRIIRLIARARARSHVRLTVYACVCELCENAIARIKPSAVSVCVSVWMLFACTARRHWVIGNCIHSKPFYSNSNFRRSLRLPLIVVVLVARFVSFVRFVRSLQPCRYFVWRFVYVAARLSSDALLRMKRFEWISVFSLYAFSAPLVYSHAYIKHVVCALTSSNAMDYVIDDIYAIE